MLLPLVPGGRLVSFRSVVSKSVGCRLPISVKQPLDRRPDRGGLRPKWYAPPSRGLGGRISSLKLWRFAVFSPHI